MIERVAASLKEFLLTRDDEFRFVRDDGGDCVTLVGGFGLEGLARAVIEAMPVLFGRK